MNAMQPDGCMSSRHTPRVTFISRLLNTVARADLRGADGRIGHLKFKETSVKELNGPRRVARRFTYANVVATLALILAVGGGSAYAASRLIKGNQIAKGTITGANIKKSTLTSKLFAKGTLRSGPAGATGPAGPAGAAGAPGSAIAYGIISTNTSGNPAFNANLSKGFTTAYSPQTGIICVAYPPGVSTNLPLSINEAGSEPDHWEQVSPAQCGGTGFEIGNISATANLTGQLAISVP